MALGLVRSRIGSVLGRVVWLGLGAQASSIGLGLYLGDTWLALTGALSLLLWCAALLMTQRSRHAVALGFLVSASLLYSSVGVMRLGWDPSFQYHLVPLIPMMMFNERLRPRAGLALGLLLLALMLFLYESAPPAPLPLPATQVLAVFNMAVALGMLALVAFEFRVASVEVERKVAELAVTDPLTGLSNRRHMQQRLQEEESRAARTQTSFCLIMADIDHFKRINDTFGHDVGDQVLMELAKIFRATLRAGDVVCRWGGEEFLVLLPHTTLDRARDAAERLRALAEAGLGNVTRAGKITLTLGVTEYVSSIDACLKIADQALYDGKQTGRNRVVVQSGRFEPPELLH